MKLDDSRYRVVENYHMSFNSRVDLVEDQLTGKRYISKSIDLNKSTPVLIHQLKTEIHILSLLNDVHVPQLSDVILSHDSMSLIETKIDGIRLDQIQNRWTVLRYRKRWALELMHLLETLHQFGFLYIDVKKENLIVSKNHLFLIDFNACIPIHSVQACMASPSNEAPELKTKSRKEVYTDIYALGSLMTSFYHFGFPKIWIRKCMRVTPQQRYPSISRTRFSYLMFLYVQRILMICVFIFLSVFWIFQNSLAYEGTLMEKYREEIMEITGTRQEKTQIVLHDWIVKGKLKNESFDDSQTAKYFLNQALLTRNAEVIRYIVQNIPKSVVKEIYVPYQMARMISSPDKPMSQKQILKLLRAIEKEKDLLTCVDNLQLFEEILLEKERVLSTENVQYLSTIHHRWTNQQMKENQEIFLKLACTHGEYCLYLETWGFKKQTLTDNYIEMFKEDQTFKKIMKMME